MSAVTRHPKIGRNDPCPCGSGLKYKRCHLDFDLGRFRAIGDWTSIRCQEVLAEHKNRFQTEYRLPVLALRREFAHQIGTEMQGRAAAEALEAYLDKIEMVMHLIAERRSRLFWIHLARRIPPVPLEGSSAWTTAVYRDVLSLAIVKHGRPPIERGDDMTFDTVSHTLRPVDLSYEDCRDIYNLEYLSLEFNDAASAYRRVGKGAILRSIGNAFTTDASLETERLMSLVDRRVERYDHLFSPFGSAQDFDPRTLTDTKSEPVIPFAALNVGQEPFPPQLAAALRVQLVAPTNYIPALIALRPARQLLELFEVQIEALLGIKPSQVLTFLAAVGLRELSLIATDQTRAAQFLQRAYWLARSSGGLESGLVELTAYYRAVHARIAGGEMQADVADAEVRRIFDAMTYTESEIRNIDLWDRVPDKVIVPYGEHVIWDYSKVSGYIQGLMSTVGLLSDSVGNVKSARFEHEVVKMISATDGVSGWESRKELRAPDGSVRQIDASLICNGILYVIECKAFSANPRVRRGDWAALQNRWASLAAHPPDARGRDGSYLHQARTLKEFIEANPEGTAYPGGTAYRVPGEVSRIEYCVCTPLSEYIPEVAPQFWFDSETPRICTPQELIEFATGQKPRLLTSA